MINVYEVWLLNKIREQEILKKAEIRRLINGNMAKSERKDKKPGLKVKY